MKSIRTKIANVLFASIIFTVIIILIVTLIGMNVLSDHDSDQILTHIGNEYKAQLTDSLNSVESSVESIFYYAEDQLGGKYTDLQGQAFRNYYLKQMEAIVLAQARNNPSAGVVYFRLSTEYDDPCGFIYTRDKLRNEFVKGELTDISMYDEDDIEHVGWYYLPKKKREAMWIGPYVNMNLNIKMLSYVAPLIIKGHFIGVAGIDIDLSAMSSELRNIEIYGTGQVMIVDSGGDMIYSKDYTGGMKRDDLDSQFPHTLEAIDASLESGEPVKFGPLINQKKLYAGDLGNGLHLCVVVPTREIGYAQSTVLVVSILVSLSILVVAMSVTILVLNGFLRPLNELTEAAEQMADGKMDVVINYNENDEIGSLAKNFPVMSTSLKHYFEHFHSLAYTDSLTGLNNKAAFEITKGVIESEVEMGRAAFSIIIMDVNNLKVINDTLGHDKGDILLRHVTEAMREALVGFPIYRIGGDEFCSIINNSDPDILIDGIQRATRKKSESDLPVFGVNYQVAAGAATYNKNIDNEFADVFKRADEAMYRNKKTLKEKDV